MINNFQDLLDYYICETEHIFRKQLYKTTDCGMSFTTTENGIVFHSIIEGSDAEAVADPLNYPFSEEDLDNTLQWVEDEVSYHWKQNEAYNTEDGYWEIQDTDIFGENFE